MVRQWQDVVLWKAIIRSTVLKDKVDFVKVSEGTRGERLSELRQKDEVEGAFDRSAFCLMRSGGDRVYVIESDDKVLADGCTG